MANSKDKVFLYIMCFATIIINIILIIQTLATNNGDDVLFSIFGIFIMVGYVRYLHNYNNIRRKRLNFYIILIMLVASLIRLANRITTVPFMVDLIIAIFMVLGLACITFYLLRHPEGTTLEMITESIKNKRKDKK